MNFNKKVTVLLPVYNAENYIEQSLESILKQTFSDFDVLLIDDGSTDNSASIINKFKDERIIYLKNHQNIGLTRTLNKGLDLIEGEYIVRMDSDDICYPERFEEQVKFMDKNKGIAVSGSNIRRFSLEGRDYKTSLSTHPKEIRTELLFNCSLMHPSVIMRNSIIKKEKYHYSTEHIVTEDFGLWRRISEKYDLGNIEKILMDYRIHDNSVSVQADKNREKRDKAHILIYKESFDALGIFYTEREMQLYRYFITHDFDFNRENSAILRGLLLRVKETIQKDKRYDVEFYEKLLSTFYRMNYQKQRKSVGDFLRVHKEFFENVFQIKHLDLSKLVIRNIQSKF